MSFTIEWHIQLDKDRQDAIWYHGAGVVGTASLVKNGKTYTVEIVSQGETVYRVPYINQDGTWTEGDSVTVRYPSDWESLGVRTDTDLQKLYDSWIERGVDIWEHNSWFDLYEVTDYHNGLSLHLDAVGHTLEEMEQLARTALEEIAEESGKNL